MPVCAVKLCRNYVGKPYNNIKITFHRTECDWVVVVGAIIVFALPLTLLIPDFYILDMVPKVSVVRYHILEQQLSWPQINAAVVSVLVIFFCLFLEIRKRKLDDTVEKVLAASQATDAVMDVERERQAAAIRSCIEVLDASAEHYENLLLLHEELCKQEKLKQHPPVIEFSSCPL